MRYTEALKIVLELAVENQLKEKDCLDNPVVYDMYIIQQEALKIIQAEIDYETFGQKIIKRFEKFIKRVN